MGERSNVSVADCENYSGSFGGNETRRLFYARFHRKTMAEKSRHRSSLIDEGFEWHA